MIRRHESPRTALVIGCGIGGPVAAMALQRAGIEPKIFEARAETADFAGSFLNLATNGLDALAAIDAQAVVRVHGFPTPRMVMWSGSGKRLGEVTNGITLPNGAASLTIDRGQLHAALRNEAIARGIPIVSGKRLVAAEPANGGVVACFADGTDASGSLLVGVDGIHSQTRRIIDAAAPAPRYTGQLSVGGRARLHTVPPTPNTFNMIFGRRGFFGYSVPVPGEVFWFANLSHDGEPTRERLAAIPADQWKDTLRDLFAVDAGPAVEIVRATIADDLAVFPIHDMPAVPRWHRDAMVILGDAAHATSPSSGQGASMAIEDAIVLAKSLRDCPTLEAAFAAYERERRGRVERVVAYSARVGRSKIAGPVARWFRDLMMPFALKHFASSDAYTWLYGHHIDAQL
jgi:FAD-dependent urate hydroxylase